MTAKQPLAAKLGLKASDLPFIGAIVLSVVIALAAINSEFEKRAASLHPAGGRKIDIEAVRRQISDGELSSKKALFYRKAPDGGPNKLTQPGE